MLTALCHHANLVHLFLVAHGVLGQKNFEILSLVHRVLLFLQSTSVGRLATYIVQNFYLDTEVKDLLKKVLGVCSKKHSLLLLEINYLPVNVQPYHVAVSNLLDLLKTDCPFAIVYPFPSKIAMYANLASHTIVTGLTSSTSVEKLPAEEDLVEGSFVILDKANVADLRNRSAIPDQTTTTNKETCIEREQWDEVVLDLETQVEDFIPHRYWLSAKSMLKEILRNNKICILEDGRRMQIMTKPHATVGITDFITAAVRKDGPSEIMRSDTEEYRTYRMFVRCMLEMHCPRSIFKNKLLLQNHASLHSAATAKTRKRRWRFNPNPDYL